MLSGSGIYEKSDKHSLISTHLRSEQPLINTLALPDFSNIRAMAKKPKEPITSADTNGGILKRDWLLKHRTKIPAMVAALFTSDQVSDNPAQWLQVCTDLEDLRMTPHKTKREATVLVRLKAYEGVPPPYDKMKTIVIPNAVKKCVECTFSTRIHMAVIYESTTLRTCGIQDLNSTCSHIFSHTAHPKLMV